MKSSDSIDQIAPALMNFQNEVGRIEKNKKGHNHRYADLAAILTATREPLFNNGLSITQLVNSIDDKVSVETILMHVSGQYFSSTLEMPGGNFKGQNEAQIIGTCITYARRYAQAAILNIAQDDDDSANAPKKNYRAQQQAPKNQAPVPYNATDNEIKSLIQTIDAYCNAFDESKEKLTKSILNYFSINNFSELNKDQYKQAQEIMKKKSKARVKEDEEKDNDNA